jgi:DNA-binding NtrC family response regulator
MDTFSKLKEFRTLLIDDDELIRDSLSLAFRNKGCSLRTSETAEEGLRALRDERFDVIISDFKLPGMDGLEFFRLASSSYPNTVNVLITAYGDKEIAVQASEIGVHEFVEKPFKVQTLMSALGRLLKNDNIKKYPQTNSSKSEKETEKIEEECGMEDKGIINERKALKASTIFDTGCRHQRERKRRIKEAEIKPLFAKTKFHLKKISMKGESE